MGLFSVGDRVLWDEWEMWENAPVFGTVIDRFMDHEIIVVRWDDGSSTEEHPDALSFEL